MYQDAARAAAERHGIPPDLFMRQIGAESSWNPNAVSPAGAIGLGQLMPGTARELGVDPNDPEQNLEGAARYLRQQYDSFGDWGLALAAYNSGPGNVRKHGGVPPFKETQNYVAKLGYPTDSAAKSDYPADYGFPAPEQGNALAGLAPAPSAGNALAALAEPQMRPPPQLWQGHDPRMFMSRRG